MREFFKKYWPYIAIVALLFFYYPQVFLFQGSWLTADHREQHFPWAAYMSETLKAGKLPFWTDQIGCGFPLAAEGQVGAFYIPNILFYLAMPARLGYNANLIAHLILSGLFFYLFLRSLRIGTCAALFGVTAYLFGSTYGGAFYNINSLKCMTWFPLALILIDKISVKIKIYQAALLAFILWQVLMAGHLQCATYVFLFSVVYFIARNMNSLKDMSKSKTLFFAMAFSYLTAFLLSLPQMLLTSQLYQHSNRINFAEAFAYIGSYNPLAAISFFIPNLDAVFEGKIYMGVISVFFLIIGAIVLWKKKDYTFFWPMLLAVILAPGIFSPVYVALVKLFKLYAFRVPMRFMLFFGFFYSVVAAYGVDVLLSGLGEPENILKSASRAFAVLAGAAIALFSVISVSLRLFDKSIYSLGEILIRNFVLGKAGHPKSMEQYIAALKIYLENAKSAFSFTTPHFFFPVAVILIAAWLLYSLRKKHISSKSFVWLSFLLLVLDLRIYPLNLTLRDYESFKDYFRKPPVVRFLEDDKSDYRIFSFSDDVSTLPLSPSYNMIYNINTANIYSPLSMRGYHRFMGKFGGVNDSTGTTPVSEDFLYSHLKQLGMLNVKYVIADKKLVAPPLKRVWSEKGISVYENPCLMLPFWLVGNIRTVKDREKIFAATQSADFNPKETVFTEDDIDRYYGLPGAATEDSIMLISRGYDGFVLDVVSSDDKMLVLSQTYYPGWKVLIDDKDDVEALRVDYLLTGIPVSEGHHKVRFYYAPDFSGMISSIISKKGS